MIEESDKNTIAYVYLTSNAFPSNSYVALEELKRELEKANTNNLERARNWKTKALCLFLIDQVYGQLSSKVNTFRAYSDLVKEIKEIEV